MAQASPTIDQTLRERLVSAAEEAEAANPSSREAKTLRTLLCALRDRDITARSRGDCAGCPEAEAQDVLRSMLAHREVAAREFEAEGRPELADQEREDIAIIRKFLPAPLSGEALEKAVRDVVVELDARKLKDMGRCMEALKDRFGERLDTSVAYKAVRGALR